ncbi:LysR family transcriptional regulator [Celeribacter indicus]|uniref:LysR family transcriptional regulator n=1 Tax=Celeribacter indicus TaxID=1208324 RepID=A0A0B5DXT5_9RHOB|nr:LysR family transcriptional regulator [Celeribacter indicus]AJE45047.1 LysR family transcriptional regulator [Celeribacter indicus]SDX42073.1 transcriptional regulator, LysR family [Celeribacter indicus]
MDLRNLDIRLLYTLDAIHRTGSLTMAAQQLHLSQPAISHTLRQLRDIFSDPLFVRTATGMTPTPKATALAGKIRHIEAFLQQELSAELPFSPAALDTCYTLCMNDVSELVLLPVIVNWLRDAAPHSQLQTMSLSAPEIPTALDRGEVDLAIGPYPDLKRAALNSTPLYRRGFMALVSSRHPRITGDALTLDQFQSEPQMKASFANLSEELFDRFVRANQLRRNVVLTVPHALSVMSVVQKSELIAIVPVAVGRYFRQFNTVRALPLAFDGFELPFTEISAYWSKRFDNDPRNRWLREFVVDTFSEPQSGTG